MNTHLFLPIRPELKSLACETINRRIAPLPFVQNGVEVTGELIGIAMECLNAETTGTLPLRTSVAMAKNLVDGFDRQLESRHGAAGLKSADTLADIMTRAGITEQAEVTDRCTRTRARGLRLLPEWRWHIASPLPPAIVPFSKKETESRESWMAKCPVCKTGILLKVSGKQLYGVKPTEFYIDCSNCGAKFVPENENFRLVSIAKIRDPRWRHLLNTSRTCEAWAIVAAGNVIVKRMPVPTLRSAAKPAGMINTGLFSRLKDGSIAVPIGEKTIFFRHVEIQFGKNIQCSLYTRGSRPLAEILALPEYAALRPDIESKYPRYIASLSGSFLSDLTRNRDTFYQAFLNEYGDREYCSLRIEENEYTHQKGVILVLANGKIGYVGACHTTFASLINDDFGRIISDMCFLDGNRKACYVNSLICESRDSAGLYIHLLTDDAAIDALSADLSVRYLPPAAPQ